jgi:curli biogenesis system outer membrane secretion channel CsgG
MTVRRFGKVAVACLAAAVLSSPALAQKKEAIEKCDTPIGTISINEPEASMVRALSGYNLGSPSGVLRILIQESNCFLVVERGSGLAQMQQERALARGGELQQASNVGQGQMAAAYFILTPGVIFSDQNAGGVGGAAGGILGHRLGVVGGGVKFKEAQTSLLVADMRSGVQVAASEGKAKKTDFALGGLGVLGVGLAGGGYTSTDEGKIIAASFRDNYNNVVRSIRANPTLLARAKAPKMGAVFNEGDVLRAKINGVQVMKNPKDGSAVVVTLKRDEEVVFLGQEEDGFLKVLAPAGEGWVRKLVVMK